MRKRVKKLTDQILSIMKKLLLSLSALLLPIVTLAEPVEIDGIYYNLNAETKEAEVAWNPDRYSGSVDISSVVIYDETEYKVTSIGSYAFWDCNELTAVSIPNTVTSIGERAFAEISSLTHLDLPDSVTKIGLQPFYCCTGLVSIVWPSSVKSIGNSCFYQCTSLISVTIPDNLKSIEDYAFYGCNALASITIPDGVTSIGSFSFCQCSSLTSITIPEGVAKIGQYTFFCCGHLATVSLPSSLTSIEECAFAVCPALASVTIPDGVTYIGDNAFTVCGLTSVTIPNSVGQIGRDAFNNCPYLTILTIGSGVWSISDKAFAQCSALTDVYCLAEAVPNIWREPFANTDIASATLHVPASALQAYSSKEPWNGFKDIVPLEGESIETTYYTSPTGHIDIYSIDGKLIGSAADQSEAARIINNLPSGTSTIVKKGGKSVKIVVK